jgi:uncharacterized membrane protein YtjA (UPF0391 family)
LLGESPTFKGRIIPITWGTSNCYTGSEETLRTKNEGEVEMDLLTWAIIAFVIAVIAGALGFTGVARGAATVSKTLFGIFLVIAVVLVLLVILGVSIL